MEHLAEVACVSPRQFLRSFKAETGETPAKAVERIRAQTARAQIESGDGSIDSVARRVGFTDSERMRRAFLRVYGCLLYTSWATCISRRATARSPSAAPSRWPAGCTCASR